MKVKEHNDKSREKRLWAGPRDLIIIGILSLIAIALLLVPSLISPANDIQVLIYHEGKVIDRFNLKEGTARILSYEQNPEIEIQQWPDQTIAFVKSDCPDQICVNTGKLRKAGEFAACLPNNFVIVLESISDAEGVDAIA